MAKSSVKRMTDREFVEHYMKAKSADDAAKAMGCTINNVYSRRTKLEKLGVKLPDFERTTQRGEKDVAGLNALIAELKGNGTETKDESTGETKTETKTETAPVNA